VDALAGLYAAGSAARDDLLLLGAANSTAEEPVLAHWYRTLGVRPVLERWQLALRDSGARGRVLLLSVHGQSADIRQALFCELLGAPPAPGRGRTLCRDQVALMQARKPRFNARGHQRVRSVRLSELLVASADAVLAHAHGAGTAAAVLGERVAAAGLTPTLLAEASNASLRSLVNDVSAQASKMALGEPLECAPSAHAEWLWRASEAEERRLLPAFSRTMPELRPPHARPAFAAVLAKAGLCSVDVSAAVGKGWVPALARAAPSGAARSVLQPPTPSPSGVRKCLSSEDIFAFQLRPCAGCVS